MFVLNGTWGRSTVDTDDDKENIPPSAVTMLEEFREEAVLSRQRRGDVPPPPPEGRRLAPRQLAEQTSQTKVSLQLSHSLSSRPLCDLNSCIYHN